MGVTVQAASTGSVTCDADTTAIIGCYTAHGAAITAASWNGLSMTSVGAIASPMCHTHYMSYWVKFLPGAGSAAISWTGGSYGQGMAIVVKGSNLSFGNWTLDTATGATTSSNSIASAVGDLVIEMTEAGDAETDWSATGGQTVVMDVYYDPGSGNRHNHLGGYKAGASSVTTSWGSGSLSWTSYMLNVSRAFAGNQVIWL